ncbi:MAG: SDR family oxidoreductase [Candidatus Bathyarchaeota archaeon]|nr:SDR family oxidoreductase [Candidatus Bathyarchaeota archaeon]
MLVSKGKFGQQTLRDEVIVVTGAGRGIGYEAARALVWLGAKVVVAEIDEINGKAAEEALSAEFGADRAFFVKTDIGREGDIEKLSEAALKKYGRIDVVLNNATVFPMAAVVDSQIGKWDLSYNVNLRGPVLLAKKFVPDMLKRRHGVFVCVSSSGAAPFMGPYEVFKTAQVELSNTLSAELEGSGVYAFTIGPGISKTPGFIEGGGKVAELMGMSLDELFELNKNAQISPEAAGAGFALAVAQAQRYHGQETSSIQVLREANIPFEQDASEAPQPTPQEPQRQPEKTPQTRRLRELYEKVLNSFMEQSEGWKKRNLFERQWVARDFKKTTGMSIDEMQTSIKAAGDAIKAGAYTAEHRQTASKIAAYYLHQREQLMGFEKNPQKLEQNLKILDGYIEDAKALTEALTIQH